MIKIKHVDRCSSLTGGISWIHHSQALVDDETRAFRTPSRRQRRDRPYQGLGGKEDDDKVALVVVVAYDETVPTKDL